MDQTQPQPAKQPAGNVVAFVNSERERKIKAKDPKAANLPMFDKGKIGLPGTDQEVDLALWGGKDGTERRMFTGFTKDAADTRPPQQQLSAMFGDTAPDAEAAANEIVQANMTFRPGQIAIFTNRATEEIYAELQDLDMAR